MTKSGWKPILPEQRFRRWAHALAREDLLGTPLRIVTGEAAEMALTATEEMVVDEKGLIQGGFTFDYADIWAVNHPFVALGGSEGHFLTPVKVGNSMIDLGNNEDTKGRRRSRSVDVNVGDVKAFKGVFAYFVLEGHILS